MPSDGQWFNGVKVTHLCIMDPLYRHIQFLLYEIFLFIKFFFYRDVSAEQIPGPPLSTVNI
jgi:hypothetical protein